MISRRVMFLPALEILAGQTSKHLLARVAFRNAAQARAISSQKVSEFLEFYPGDNKDGQKSDGRLTIFLTWLMAKPAHVTKYVKLFTDYNIDVLKVQVSSADLMRPTARTQVAAKQLCEYLLENPQFDKLFVYGFSVGAYQFCESVKMIQEDPSRYASLPPRFVGHMWDSPVDVPGVSDGISQSVTKNPALQRTIKSYIEWFRRVRYESATRHYWASSALMHKGPLSVPSLYMYSLQDPMSCPKINQKIITNWRQSGVDVQTREFEKGKHCAIYSSNKEEYLRLVYEFLLKVGLLTSTAAVTSRHPQEPLEQKQAKN